jgi:RNA polymerase sigma factor (TIGR02999 family)
MQAGDAEAREYVFHRVYDELRATAAAIMGSRARGTFQPSDLVSGAYVRLLAADKPWESRRHFMDVAADAMLHVLIDHVRRRKAKKRGGGRARLGEEALEGVVRSLEDRGIVMLDLYAAIRELEAEKPEWARFAKLRLFAGLDVARVCEVMGLSLRTGEREWKTARTILGSKLRGWDPDASAGGPEEEDEGPGPAATRVRA